MHNLWLMAKHEYRKMVGKRSFLLGTLGIPLLIIVILSLIIFVFVRGEDDRPLGYVDHSGILAQAVLPPADVNEETIELRAFTDETAAQQALEAGDIQAYYVLQDDYLQTRAVNLVYWEDDPSDAVRSDFADFVRANTAVNRPPEIQTLLMNGPNLTVRSLDGSRELDSSNPLGFVLPFVAAFLFIFVVMASAGYLLQVVTDEKENRTMELMVTSITPLELIGGKALGLMAVSLTQLLIWLGVAVIALLFGSDYIPLLQNVNIPWSFLVVIVLYFLPSYALVAGIMTAIGGAVTELQQGQQVAGILNLLFMAPFFFIAFFMTNPNSPILLVLTLFPTTAFLTVIMRWSLSVVPMWQMVLSWFILVGTAVLSVIASARIFRVGMLRYGQRMRWKSIVAAVRSRQ
ncbi:MAG: ABC transporter permease [Ardenticatenaceae bacterium]|nr:ABC transporter permease [Anaerolineales bacterium]MCB8923544.1 ABC transporter permease [Ardenticatenaceae bacterium]MCB8991885.1 ABC transporter permease [Ardenticatenaceae bacterium]MCB9003731.1 ABC transporter permease [Ardenticatenaceae bacterium]